MNDDKKEEKTRAFQLRYLHLSSDRVISAVLLTNRNGMNVTAEVDLNNFFFRMEGGSGGRGEGGGGPHRLQ